MKQIIITIAVIMSIAFVPRGEKTTDIPERQDVPEVSEPTAADTLWTMAEAFAWVESRGDHMAYNEKEDAVGLLQIRPIMVREANRLLGEEAFILADRWEPLESIDIFCTVMEHLNPTLDIDRAIDIWNPRCPTAYRQSVKQEFAKALEQ